MKTMKSADFVDRFPNKDCIKACHEILISKFDLVRGIGQLHGPLYFELNAYFRGGGGDSSLGMTGMCHSAFREKTPV